jgi:hypothetical protein
MKGLSLVMLRACASGTGSIQLTLTLLLAGGVSGYAQAPPDSQPELVVCEDARVTLGESKQDVNGALSVCCRRNRLPAFLNDDRNQIDFESRDGSRKCEGELLFDGQERLVFAIRNFTYDPLDAATLADNLFQAVDRLLQGQPGQESVTWKNKSSEGRISLGKLSGPKGSLNELQLEIGTHLLRLQGAPSQSRLGDRLHVAYLSDEIGDPRKHVAQKPKTPAPE